jgi:hypothetical protein
LKSEYLSLTKNTELRSSFDLRLPASVPFVEPVNASSGVYELLLASEERVTIGTNFNVKVLAERRAGLKSMTAGADNVDLLVVRMDNQFHFFY